jgi:hypothetical protein
MAELTGDDGREPADREPTGRERGGWPTLLLLLGCVTRWPR